MDGGSDHTNGMFTKGGLFTQNSSRSCVSNQNDYNAIVNIGSMYNMNSGPPMPSFYYDEVFVAYMVPYIYHSLYRHTSMYIIVKFLDLYLKEHMSVHIIACIC